MMSGGLEVDVEGRIPTAKTTHLIICLSFLLQFWTQTLVWSKLLQLAFKLSAYIFDYRSLPSYVHVVSTHVMNETRQAFPVFHCSSVFV